MKTYNVDVNTARMMANNGIDFIENTSKHTGVWCGFVPHSEGCKVSAIKIVNASGDEKTNPTWVATTANLESYISAGLVNGQQGFITEITLSEGAAHLLIDTIKGSQL